MRLATALAVLAPWGVIACGDGRVLESDGPAPPDAGERGIVHVKVTGFVEKAGLRVIFQERDSSVSLATRTDANGEVMGRLGPDGFVTLVAGVEPTLELWTYTGVQPGDEVEFFEPEGVNIETPADSVGIFAEGAGAPPFTLVSSCGGATTLFDALPVAPVLTVCGDRMDFLLERGQVYRYAHDVDMTVRPYRVDFPAVYSDYAQSAVTVIGAPWTLGAVSQTLLGQGFPLERTQNAAEVVDGALQITLGLPLPPAGTVLTEVDSLDDPFAQHVVDWRPATSELALAYDEVVVAPATTPPRYVATRSAIAWTEGSGTPGTLVRATLHWLDGAHARTRSWVIVGPRAAGDEPLLRVPVLPAQDLVPAVDAPQTIEAFVVDAAQLAYLRLHMHGRWLAQGVAWPASGDAGRVVWRSL